MKQRTGQPHKDRDWGPGPFRNGVHSNPRLPAGMVNDDGSVNSIAGVLPEEGQTPDVDGWRAIYDHTTGMGFVRELRGL